MLCTRILPICTNMFAMEKKITKLMTYSIVHCPIYIYSHVMYWKITAIGNTVIITTFLICEPEPQIGKFGQLTCIQHLKDE